MQCKRCFWLDIRKKISRPSTPPFNINKAIDNLFKKEFNYYRNKSEPHPIMTDNQINAVPFSHQDLDIWRQNFTGIGYLDKTTNLYIYGAVDDIWVDDKGKLIVVDYKATAKNSDVTIDSDWQISYKRQLEIYQWLLRKNSFKVNNRGYFVYANAKMDLDGFYDKIEFLTKILPYDGNDEWISETILEIKKCLESEQLPPVGQAIMGGSCEYCQYAKVRSQLTLDELTKDDNKLKLQIIKSLAKI
ncbi:MAG TPA: PD-(D/E)XK nuclease family protein [Patescibacteria group bacterium]|nr:PD-(D/E)XK nuclease family protein [Patescibacteria group bacterium]